MHVWHTAAHSNSGIYAPTLPSAGIPLTQTQGSTHQPCLLLAYRSLKLRDPRTNPAFCWHTAHSNSGIHAPTLPSAGIPLTQTQGSTHQPCLLLAYRSLKLRDPRTNPAFCWHTAHSNSGIHAPTLPSAGIPLTQTQGTNPAFCWHTAHSNSGIHAPTLPSAGIPLTQTQASTHQPCLLLAYRSLKLRHPRTNPAFCWHTAHSNSGIHAPTLPSAGIPLTQTQASTHQPCLLLAYRSLKLRHPRTNPAFCWHTAHSNSGIHAPTLPSAGIPLTQTQGSTHQPCLLLAYRSLKLRDQRTNPAFCWHTAHSNSGIHAPTLPSAGIPLTQTQGSTHQPCLLLAYRSLKLRDPRTNPAFCWHTAHSNSGIHAPTLPSAGIPLTQTQGSTHQPCLLLAYRSLKLRDPRSNPAFCWHTAHSNSGIHAPTLPSAGIPLTQTQGSTHQPCLLLAYRSLKLRHPRTNPAFCWHTAHSNSGIHAPTLPSAGIPLTQTQASTHQPCLLLAYRSLKLRHPRTNPAFCWHTAHSNSGIHAPTLPSAGIPLTQTQASTHQPCLLLAYRSLKLRHPRTNPAFCWHTAHSNSGIHAPTLPSAGIPLTQTQASTHQPCLLLAYRSLKLRHPRTNPAFCWHTAHSNSGIHAPTLPSAGIPLTQTQASTHQPCLLLAYRSLKLRDPRTNPAFCWCCDH